MSAKSGVRLDALILEDPGSTDNFIIHELTEELQLPSRPMASESKNKKTRIYQFVLKDMQGRKYKVSAIGINKGTNEAVSRG